MQPTRHPEIFTMLVPLSILSYVAWHQIQHKAEADSSSDQERQALREAPCLSQTYLVQT